MYIQQQLKILVSNFTMRKFHSLEVVDRGSETQLQVSENLDEIFWPLYVQ